ncbi:helix-turn-helix domain-containing protein [Vibrio sp. McD22-P3]|uniref:helix-turn-helix domain-containing protein n=1 Tax=Vibrio sp. McD22-P3 TaxID=2724880 RepID=UPI001F172F07|nr:helix-turn-helix domain-containing protein [Vibrio sp. McD22-P3]MCF4171933.1 helix-turn-helix domain-containing protein [Vibrio sp. McD22-P3]
MNKLANRQVLCPVPLQTVEFQRELDIRAAQNLKNLWLQYKRNNKLTQEEFANCRLGWSQGNFSQYLNGKTPIGRKSLLKLSEALKCKPSDIREEFKDGDVARFRTATETLLLILRRYQVSHEDSLLIRQIEKLLADE